MMSEPTYVKRATTFWKEVKKIGLSAIILAGGAATLFAMYANRPIPEDRSKDVLIPLVSAFDAQSYTGLLDREISGTVVPFREIKVATEVAGTVAEKYEACQAGNFVKAGEPLLKIDQQDFLLELETIKHEITQSKKTIAETEEEIRGATRNLELAQTEYEIQEQDYLRNERLGNALSKSEMTQARRALLAAETNLTARKNTLAQLEAKKVRLDASLSLAMSRLDKAQLNLDRTEIKAPDNGVIVSESVEKGDYVPRGTILFVFEDTRRAEIVCNLTSDDLEWIRENSVSDINSSNAIDEPNLGSVYKIPKTDVMIYDRDNPDVSWQGTLERFDGIGRDESTKTMPARIVVDQPIIKSGDAQVALVRGMYVKCRIAVQTSARSAGQEFLYFPEVAARPDNFVWVIRKKIAYATLDPAILRPKKNDDENEKDGKTKEAVVVDTTPAAESAGAMLILKLAASEVDVLKRVPIRIIDRIDSQFQGETNPFVVVVDDDNLKPGDKIVVSPISQPTVDAIVEIEKDSMSEKSVDQKTADETKESSPETSETT